MSMGINIPCEQCAGRPRMSRDIQRTCINPRLLHKVEVEHPDYTNNKKLILQNTKLYTTVVV